MSAIHIIALLPQILPQLFKRMEIIPASHFTLDLESYVGVDLSVMEGDYRAFRRTMPFVFVNCKTEHGIVKIAGYRLEEIILKSDLKALLS